MNNNKGVNNFAENLKKTIQIEEIKPIPRWIFWAKNFSILFFFIVSVCIGAFAFSFVLQSILERAFQGIRPAHIEFIRSIPLLWLFFFSIFSALAIWGIQHLPKAYKITPIFFIAGNIISSIVIGIGMYIFDIPEKITYIHTQHEKNILHDWNAPETGFLAGEIIKNSENKEKNTVQIKTITAEIWTLEFQEKIPEHFKNKKFIKIKGEIKRGLERGLERNKNNIFIVEKIFPFRHNRFH